MVFYPPIINYRKPAAVTPSPININNDFHVFYKNFITNFYEVIKNDQDIFKTFEVMNSFKAVMGGDVNVENFGLVFNKLGGASLALND